MKKSKSYSAFVNLIGLFEGLSIFTGVILTVLLKYKPL